MVFLSRSKHVFAIILGLVLFMSCLTKKIVPSPFPPSPPPINEAPKDSDGDGVPDRDDKCPDSRGLASLAGCPDRDGDGIPDRDDKCPDIAGSVSKQGCPIPDTDKDGINDEIDKCPTVPGIARYQGCPIPDTDGDGINDEEDKCLNEPGPKVNAGCPVINSHPVIKKPEVTVDPTFIISHWSGHEPNTGTFVLPKIDSARKAYPDASISYSFHNKMKKGDKLPIQIIVELDRAVQEVEEKLRQIVAAQRAVQVTRSDSAIVKSLVIRGDKYFLIEIKVDPDIFDYKLMVGEQKQELKRGMVNKWVWELTAKKEAKNSDVYITVKSFGEDEKSSDRDYTVLPIQITVDFSLSEFLKKNWPYLLILIAGLGFIAYLIWKKTPSNSVYLSYAWNTNQDFIKALYKSLKRKFNIRKDEEDLENQGRISKFMTEIGKGKIIVVAISDKYLRSPFCMCELYEVYLNAGMDADVFSKRIFPIRLEEITLSDKEVVNQYQLYWKAEKEKWEKQIGDDRTGVKTEEIKQYENIRRIEGEVENILYIIADIKAFFPDKLLQANFKELKDAIRARLKEKE